MNDRRPKTRRGVAVMVAVLGWVLGAPASAGTPEADFAARASHPDVVFAEGFDSATAVTAKRLPDARAAYTTFSSAQKASGAGSLQFEIPSLSPANSSGNWRTNFSADNSVKFGTGEHLYVQWRQRFSASMLNTLYTTTDGGGGGWKQILIGEGDSPGQAEVGSCTRLEVVVNNGLQRHFPQLYHSCGDYWPLQERLAPSYYKLQNAVDAGAAVTPLENRFPLYPFEPTKVTALRAGSPAVGYYPDEWMTFQIHLAPGPLGCAVDPLIGATRCGFTNSTVEMWVARAGAPAVLTHRFTGVVLQRDAGATASAEKYGKLWLTPYHTNKDSTQVHPVGYTWYDELIVSRSRIADPGVSSAPTAPTVTPANSGEGRDIRSAR